MYTKYCLKVDEYDQLIILKALADLRKELLASGRHSDVLDNLILKIGTAEKRRNPR